MAGDRNNKTCPLTDEKTTAKGSGVFYTPPCKSGSERDSEKAGSVRRNKLQGKVRPPTRKFKAPPVRQIKTGVAKAGVHNPRGEPPGNLETGKEELARVA